MSSQRNDSGTTTARRLSHTPRLSALLLVVVGLAATSGAAALKPDRTLVLPSTVREVTVTGGSIAWVHAPRALQVPGERTTCGEIGIWFPASNERWRFTPTIDCARPAFAEGVWEVSVATRRLLWIEYRESTLREWHVVTALPTTGPERIGTSTALDQPDPPYVLGHGSPAGIPLAAGTRVAYVGERGRPIFSVPVRARVLAVAAGMGPRGLRVAAALANGTVVGFDRHGRVVSRIRAKRVVALRVARLGIAVQRGRTKGALVVPYPSVTIGSHVVQLPESARMADVAQGRVLWTRDGDLGVTVIASARHSWLVDGSRKSPVLGSLSESGLAWSTGRVLHWRAGVIQDGR